jgi:hypothetical protein
VENERLHKDPSYISILGAIMPRRSLIGLSLLLLMTGFNSAFAQNEQAAIEAAMKTFDKEADGARKAYDEAIAKANKKLVTAYDVSIRGAMRRGGGDGLDLANKLNEDKKKLVAKMEASGAGSPMSPVESLVGKTWYWHWEQANKDLPMRLLPDGTIVDGSGNPKKETWTMERKWVVTISGHQFIQVSDNLYRGFLTESGRQVGLIAEPKK